MKCPNCNSDLVYRQTLFYFCLSCKKEYRLKVLASELIEVDDIITEMKGGN